MVTLLDFLAERRKLELGLNDTPASIEAMRNKGGQRTDEKHELLRRADARALAAGRNPFPSYY